MPSAGVLVRPLSGESSDQKRRVRGAPAALLIEPRMPTQRRQGLAMNAVPGSRPQQERCHAAAALASRSREHALAVPAIDVVILIADAPAQWECLTGTAISSDLGQRCPRPYKPES